MTEQIIQPIQPKKNYFKLFLYLLIIIAVIVIIWVISNIPVNTTDMPTAICIAIHSELYVSKTCSHCVTQKGMLGNYSGLFKIIDCIDEPQTCQEKDIIKVPSWIINNETYLGYQNWKRLKNLTGC